VIQIGVAIALWLGHMLHLDNDKIRLTVSGLAAGFACLFGTPITAIFFSLEMFVSGALQYKGLGAAIVSATVASLVAKACGLVPMRYDLPLNYTFSYIEFVKIGLLGICCGWVGSFMAWSLKFSRKQLKKYFPNPYRRVFVSSCFIAIMMFLCWHGRYSGLSRDLLDTAIAGQIDMPWDWVLKIFFTILCLAAGFQGGEVMPLCVIGATFGSYFGNLLGLPVPFSAALGIAAVFASGTNTLVAPIFFGTELFHGHYARYFAIVCALSFYCNHNRSIYEKQRRLRS
jgi:H+/Cl- antiporter ClcA